MLNLHISFLPWAQRNQTCTLATVWSYCGVQLVCVILKIQIASMSSILVLKIGGKAKGNDRYNAVVSFNWNRLLVQREKQMGFYIYIF